MNIGISKEYKNFFFYALRDVRHWPQTFSFFTKIIKLKIEGITASKQHRNYPKYAMILPDLAKQYEPEKQVLPGSAMPLGFPFEFVTSIFKYQASKEFTWQSFNVDFSDPEQFFSINRWYWLLYDQERLQNLTTEQICRLTISWIISNPYDSASSAWEAYSTSERISSFSIAMLLKMSFEELRAMVQNDPDLKQFIRTSIYHLANNLEYYPGAVTFNHVLNNLKGIIIAACILEDEQMLAVAYDIFLKEAVVFDNEGFLREGSSHYQLIVSRWLCEMEYVLQNTKTSVSLKDIHGMNAQILEKVRFFIVRNAITGKVELPLFGDISPDFDPLWMLEYFTSGSISDSGRSHYGDHILSSIGLANSTIEEKEVALVYNSYSKVIKGDWVVFLKHSCNQGEFYPTHTHNDFSNYLIYYKGQPVVVDPGRQNYMKGPHADEYCFAQSHNVLLINDLPVADTGNYYYLAPYYKKASYNVTVSEANDVVKLALSTEAVRRIGWKKLSCYNKYIIIGKSEISIEECIVSSGNVPTTSTIILDNSVSLAKNNESNFTLGLPGKQIISLQLSSSNTHTSSFDIAKRYNSFDSSNKITCRNEIGKNSQEVIKYKIVS